MNAEQTEEPPEHVHGYARTSPATPDPTPQVDMLTAIGCDHIWLDTPARPHTQPEFAKLLDHAHPGDLIVVCRLDRLATNLHQLVTCVNDVDRRGLHLRLIDEGLDSSDPLAPPLMPVLKALADFQHHQIQEQTHVGLATARARGRVGGRPPVMNALKRQRALQLHNTGATTAMIATALEVSRATIYRFLADSGDLTPNQMPEPAPLAAAEPTQQTPPISSISQRPRH